MSSSQRGSGSTSRRSQDHPAQPDGSQSDDVAALAERLRIRHKGLTELFNYSKQGLYNDCECLKCGKGFPKNKLDRLIKHIRECAADEAIRDEILEEWKKFNEKKITKASNAEPDPQDPSDDIDQLVLTFIGQNALPYSITRSSSFQALIAALDKDYTLPTPYKLSRRLAPSRAAANLESVRLRINGGYDFAITVEFDAWTSNSGMSILGIVLTAKNGDSALLDLVDISAKSHTAEYLAKCAISSLRTARIKMTKLNAITSDEASNFKRSRNLICKEEKLQHLIEFRCMAHVFNLVGASISKHPTIKRLLDNIVQLINTITRDKPLATAIVNLGGGRVVNAVPTRWYSTCSAINSLIKIRMVMDGLDDRPEYNRHKWSYITEDESFWCDIDACKVFFDRLSRMIGVAECRDTRFGTAFNILLEFGRFLFKELDNTVKFVNIARDAFLKYFCRIDIDLLLAAYVMDPNYCTKWITRRGTRRAQQKVIQLILQSRCADPDDATTVEETEENDDNLTDALDDEFRRYINRPKKGDESIRDVHTYWKSKRDFIILKQVGMRLAACHASSANTERIFSALSRMCIPARNRLSIDSLTNLLSIMLLNPINPAKAIVQGETYWTM